MSEETYFLEDVSWGLPLQVGERCQWEWCELDCICLMGLHVFGETEGCEGWGDAVDFLSGAVC